MPNTKCIHTYLRFRPSLETESQKLPNSKSFESLFLIDKAYKTISADSTHSRKCFSFDKVFHPTESQTDVYSEVGRPLVRHVLAGLNASILLYGTTGSGKTYTFLGPEWDPHQIAERERREIIRQGFRGRSAEDLTESDESAGRTSPNSSDDTQRIVSDSRPSSASSMDNVSAGQTNHFGKSSYFDLPLTDGLVPRIITEIFREANADELSEFDVTVSFVEVYQEQVFDLLTGNSKVYIQDSRKGFVSLGAGVVECRSAKQVLDTIRRGIVNRRVGSTDSNKDSSRSHAVVILTVSKQCEGQVSLSQLCLCDLAGSERVEKTKATDQRLEEAKKINTSLLSLRQVIFALSRKNKLNSQSAKDAFIPYRNSKLTRLLRNSLGGNAMCSFVCTASSHEFDFWESIATMEFSQAAATIRNKPKINKTYTSKQLMKMLKEERVRKMQLNMMCISLEEEIAFYRSVFQQHKNFSNAATIGLQSMLPFYLCPLSGFIFKDPVVAADGITYERKEISKYMGRFNFSPVTGKEFKYRFLVQNTAIQMQINFISDMYGSLLDNIRDMRDFSLPLPDEVICCIFMFLPEDMLFGMATICKRWWMIMSSDYLQNQLGKREDFMSSNWGSNDESNGELVWSWIVHKKRTFPDNPEEERADDRGEPLLIR